MRRIPKGIYAVPVDEVIEGTVLVADGGFTCVKDGEKVIVNKDNGRLFFRCSEGYHWLRGQVSVAGEHDLAFDHYIGLKAV